jgi:hypothetical protein
MKRAFEAYLRILSRNLNVEIEDNHNKTQSGVCPNRDLKHVSLEYKLKMPL